MLYKGQDLDLGTPVRNGRISHGPMTSQNSGTLSVLGPFNAPDTLSEHVRWIGEPPNSGSILVDDAVLSLCNQARDLAVIHGAATVGLAHLLHAMTQNKATLVALYEHNIHVSKLRQETAALILDEFPGLRRNGWAENSNRSPPKSKEFEDVLAHAADLAYARRSPVITTDIIDTLFDMSRDNPTRKILHRHRPDFDLRDTTAAPGDDARPKVRVSVGNHHVDESPRIPTGVPSVTDTLQSTRMDAIERAIRDLTEDMARNQATFSSLVGGLRDTNHNGIPDAMERRTNGHASSWDDDDANDISYLIGRMESNVEAKFKELARAWSVLGDRLKALEDVVEDIDFGSGTPFEMTPDLEAKLKSLSIGGGRLDELEKLLTSLPQRLTEMERRLQGLATNGLSSQDIERLTSKIENVEHLIKDSDGSVELGPVMSGLRDVEAGMRGVGGQLREVDNRTGDVNLVLEGVSERQQRLEELIDSQQGQIADVLRIVRDDFDFSTLTGSTGDRDAMISSVGSLVSERFTGLSTQLQQRMGQLEDLMKSSLDRPVVVNGSGDIDTSYLNDAVAKIISNQHTLASSMDEWRMQSREDVSGLVARMDRFENKPVAPGTLSEAQLQQIVDRLKVAPSTLPPTQQPTQPTIPVVAEADGWTRFKIWMFGTNDWYGESWGGLREEDGRVWQDPRRETEQATPPPITDQPIYDRNNGYDQRA